jgi:aspartyl-tRNA(Asn)/glutamyl-tRNA(Gln) amidotransferase subunit A
MTDSLPPGIAPLALALSRGETTSTAATRAYLARIARDDSRIHAFVQVLEGTALAAAAAADERRERGQSLGALDGIPLAVKDNVDVAGVATAGGIEHYRGNIAVHDAPIVSALRAAGAVILGKLNLHEGALGATNDNPWFGRCENPRRAGYTPGGSSGGSAAAVAAGFCAAAVGSDTLGSVRIPAAYCGIAGLKPTYGVLSTRGVMPLAWTYDTLGFLGHSVADLAMLLEATLVHDAEWPFARPHPYPGLAPLASVADLRIGRPRDTTAMGLDPAVRASFETAIARLGASGARIVDLDFSGYDWTRVRREGLLISEIEGAVVHAEALERDPEGFSPEFRGMLAFGASQSAPRAARAYRRMAETRLFLERRFDAIDVLVLPTAPQPSFPFGQPVPVNQADCTAIANILGAPAACVPFGTSADGLPLSIQAVALPFREDVALGVAACLEAAERRTT